MSSARSTRTKSHIVGWYDKDDLYNATRVDAPTKAAAVEDLAARLAGHPCGAHGFKVR